MGTGSLALRVIDFAGLLDCHPGTGSRLEPRRTRAEELHAQAQKCQRLASESLDPFVREALIELASDYEHVADA
jgi:hypothetical protein